MATCTARTVRLWDARTRELERELPSLDDEVHWLEFSPDGRWLLAGCPGGAMQLFSSHDGRPAGPRMRHAGRVRFAEFSADGTRVVTASSDHTARVWSVPGGEPLTPPLRHRDAVNFAAFSSDGTRVVTCATDHDARVWDAATGRPLTQPLHHIEQPLAAAFTPDGTTLYTSGADSVVRRWRAGRPPDEMDESKADAGFVWPAGETASVRTSADGRLKLTLDPGQPFAVLDDGTTRRQLGSLTTALDRIPVAEFSPDSTLVVTASTDKMARVWNANTGALIVSVRHTRTVAAVAFSPDSHRVVTASWDGTARIWDARTGALLTRPLVHDDHVLDARFSPDGLRIATASRDKTVRLWDAATGQPLTEPLRHSAPVMQVRFHPDGQRIIASTADGTARVSEVPDFSTLAPAWLPQLADAISLNELPSDPITAYALIARYERTRSEPLASQGDDHYARLARRLFVLTGKVVSPAAPRE